MISHKAALVGLSEYKPVKISALGSSELASLTGLETCADLASKALVDAGLSMSDVDGVSLGAVYGITETSTAVPITVSEYLGIRAQFGDLVDLHGASSVGMVARAASAIEQGLANVVICFAPGNTWRPDIPETEATRRFGGASYRAGAPQAEFEIPYGHVQQNAQYAMIAQRYAHVHGYDPRMIAKLVVHQRANACATPDAIFYGQPLTEEDVLTSPMVATPIRKLEIVMPVFGGAAIIVASEDIARRCSHRPVWVTGYGESLFYRSPQYAPDMLRPAMTRAAPLAFARAGLTTEDVDVAQIYDCYPITTIMTLEAAGFFERGEAMAFLRDHDFRWHGDFPLNTNGGQLGYGQGGMAGAMCQITEAMKQVSGRAAGRQVKSCDVAFVTGNGSIMSEQNALILQGD